MPRGTAMPQCLATSSEGEVLLVPRPGMGRRRLTPVAAAVLGACAAVVLVTVWSALDTSELLTQAAGTSIRHGPSPTMLRPALITSSTAISLLPNPHVAAAEPAEGRMEVLADPQVAGPLPAAVLAGVAGLAGLLAAWWGRRTAPRRGMEAVSLGAMTGRYAMFQEDQHTQDGITETIVKNLKDRYGDLETKKVVRAWRRMQSGVVHTESHGVHPLMVQRCNLYVDGLWATPRPVWENADIAWAGRLEEQWKTIQAELKKAVDSGDEWVVDQKHEGWIFPNRHGGSDAYGPEWKILNIMERGQWNEASMRLFPETCRILREAEIPLMEAEFACLPAESYITPHSDGWNFMLTAHLPLLLPRRSSAYGLSVGDCTTKWKEGELLLFDSSFLHEAYNRSMEDRYVLLLRVWHPELTSVEQQALLYLFEVMEKRFLPGGKKFTGTPPPAESFYITIEEDKWKLPAGENTFDTRVFGPNIVLYDRKFRYYTACHSGTRFYVEPDHYYELRELKNLKPAAVERPLPEPPAEGEVPPATEEGPILIAEDPFAVDAKDEP
eukprot:EG_transcript_5175